MKLFVPHLFADAAMVVKYCIYLMVSRSFIFDGKP